MAKNLPIFAYAHGTPKGNFVQKHVITVKSSELGEKIFNLLAYRYPHFKFSKVNDYLGFAIFGKYRKIIEKCTRKIG